MIKTVIQPVIMEKVLNTVESIVIEKECTKTHINEHINIPYKQQDIK